MEMGQFPTGNTKPWEGSALLVCAGIHVSLILEMHPCWMPALAAGVLVENDEELH